MFSISYAHNPLSSREPPILLPFILGLPNIFPNRDAPPQNCLKSIQAGSLQCQEQKSKGQGVSCGLEEALNTLRMQTGYGMLTELWNTCQLQVSSSALTRLLGCYVL